MPTKNKYQCIYISGGGTEIDGGIWEKTETPKRITLNLVDKPFFDMNWDKLTISKSGGVTHCYEADGDSFSLYPFGCGTPHIFTLIN